MTTLTPEVKEKMKTEITSVLKPLLTGDSSIASSDLQEKVLEATLERLRSPPDTTTILGRITDMTCRCGGKLQESRTVANVSLPKPTHRKKRILKKLLKRWERENKTRQLFSDLIGLMQKPYFKCISCGSNQRFYSAMLRNLITVQSLDIPEQPSTTNQ